MHERMSQYALATASDLVNSKENTPPETATFAATLTQRSVFDVSLGILAMNVCGNLYSCFDYLSTEATGFGLTHMLHPKKFLLEKHALYCQFQVFCCIFMVTCAGLFYQYFVLKYYRENKLAVVNISYVLTLVGILMLVCGNENNALGTMFVASMFITFGSYLGHLTSTNTILMLMGSECQKPEYKFKKYRKMERA